MLPTYAHLVAAALFPIYTGAHASLSRPSTAAKPCKQRKPTSAPADDDDDTDDEDDEQRLMEGLSPMDALLMPLCAGLALASLYFLLKWMKDPALLNKLLNAYFAIFGVFSVSRLVADALDFGHSIIYPRRHVLRGALYHVHASKAMALPVAGPSIDAQPIATPLPGFLATLPLPERVRRLLWADRAMPGNKWIVELRRRKKRMARFRIGPHDLAGAAVALLVVAYFNLVDKPWYLTNLLGFGFSYGALQLMSPTTFATGSLILGTLFFYDIYFVFFTPMMVTVAKSLDVPIKLMFPRPSPADDPSQGPSHAMLGLGDVVLPGIMIGLALRFDLYLFYLRQQKRTPSSTPGEKDTVQKARYAPLAGHWTDHFWTHSLAGRPLWTAPNRSNNITLAPFTFPKTYFHAALVGYILGLLATLGIMVVWQHAQPALLYLVPGVLGSLWLTALVRGEVNLMWDYTEEVEDEENSKPTADKRSTVPCADSDVRDKNGKDKSQGTSDQSNPTGGEAEKARAKHEQRARCPREIFSFSIEAPWQWEDAGANQAESDELSSLGHASTSISEKLTCALSEKHGRATGTEPVGKRVRLR